MAGNSLVKRTGAALQEVCYESNGIQVKLNADIIKNYLVGDNKHFVTDQDVVLFMELCRAYRLNPFVREAYIVKFSEDAPATIVPGKDAFTKRADRNPDFDGYEAGVIVLNAEKKSEERQGSIVLPGEQLLGGWAKVYRKSRSHVYYSSLSFNERAGRKKDGSLNQTWAKQPAGMIRKCALVDALRDAFPDELAGLYTQEEIEEVNDIVLDQNIIEAPAEEEPGQEDITSLF